MTTKEEVLRLAEENCYMVHHRAVHTGYEFNVNQLTKIVELAKTQGAEEERKLSYEREKEIVRLACKAAADQAREHQKEIESIRARSKS